METRWNVQNIHINGSALRITSFVLKWMPSLTIMMVHLFADSWAPLLLVPNHLSINTKRSVKTINEMYYRMLCIHEVWRWPQFLSNNRIVLFVFSLSLSLCISASLSPPLLTLPIVVQTTTVSVLMACVFNILAIYFCLFIVQITHWNQCTCSHYVGQCISLTYSGTYAHDNAMLKHFIHFHSKRSESKAIRIFRQAKQFQNWHLC